VTINIQTELTVTSVTGDEIDVTTHGDRHRRTLLGQLVARATDGAVTVTFPAMIGQVAVGDEVVLTMKDFHRER
jgi:hypothetical protein